MTTAIRDQQPTSARFLHTASVLMEDARVEAGDVAWTVTRADGDELIVLCAAGEEPALVEGERIQPSTESDLLLPLELPDGTVFGALCALGAGPEERASVALGRLRRVAEVLRDLLAAEWEAHESTARAEAEARRARQAEDEALSDPLTGVANRRAWERALHNEERRRRRYGGAAAVVVVDLDDLKSVNDTQGHLGGDLLLRMTAEAIQATCRDSDVVARTGGDEFAVLALDCDEPRLRILVSRLRKALAQEGISASVGGATRGPGMNLEEAWAAADAAMYVDKTRRRSAPDV